MDPIRIYDYLETARGRIFDACRALSSEQYREEFDIGLGSIARTLHHCRAAEHMYMWRVSGETGTPLTPSAADDPEITSSRALPFDELERRWVETAVATRLCLARASDESWMIPRQIETSWNGRVYRYEASPSDFFCQLLVHEVHHRTQAVHMLRRLGVTVGEIDFSMLMFLTDLPDG